MKRRKFARKTTRVYYNEPGQTPLWWVVRVTDAKKAIKVNSTFMDALMGAPGTTIGCHLSCCVEKHYANFPHPVLMASFTARMATIITKVTDGKPSDAVQYEHRLGRLVDLNDMDSGKRAIKENPDLVDRDFILSPPRRHKKSQAGQGRVAGVVTKAKTSFMPRGALRRAVNAGLVSAPVAKALEGLQQRK